MFRLFWTFKRVRYLKELKGAFWVADDMKSFLVFWMWELLIGIKWVLVMGGTLFSCLDWSDRCVCVLRLLVLVRINGFWGLNRALLELEIRIMQWKHVPPPPPPHECAWESRCVTTQAIMQSEVRGAAFLHWAHVSRTYNVNLVSAVWNCDHVFFIRASQPGSRVKASKGETFAHSVLPSNQWVSASPPMGLKLVSLRLLTTFINESSCSACIDVWFDTLHWFINVVVHFLKSLSS